MGVVYEAEQLSLGRRVALKVLPFAAGLGPANLRRFRLEAQLAASLHHDHIVPVHGVGCERGVHYYVMQFIEGQSLAEFLRCRRPAAERSGPPQRSAEPAGGPGASPTAPIGAVTHPSLSAVGPAYYRTVAALVRKAAEALHHAHEQGVIHRDVKPGNLLVDRDGKVWVADFGLALAADNASLSVTGDVVGTLRYLSPEAALGQRDRIDARSDVYSLGVTLYELLTFHLPFVGDNRQALIARITAEEPVPPRRLRPDLPADLETIVLKAMAKEPAERYATARELADDLGRWLDDRTVLARRPTLRQRAAKWSRRHRRPLAAVLATFVLSLLVSVTLLAAAYRQANDALTQATEALDQAEKSDRSNRKIVEEVLVPSLMHWLRSSEKMADLPDELLDKMLATWDEVASREGNDPKKRLTIVRGYFRLSQVLANRQDRCRTEEALQKALVRMEKLIADYPDNPDYQLELSGYYTMAAIYAWTNGRGEESIELHEHSRAIVEVLLREKPKGPILLDVLANRDRNLAALYGELLRWKEAVLALQRTEAVVREMTLKYPDKGICWNGHAIQQERLSQAYRALGRGEEAVSAARTAVEAGTRAVEKSPRDTEYQIALVGYYSTLGNQLDAMGRLREAREPYEAAVRHAAKFRRDHPNYHLGTERLIAVTNELALTCERLGDTDGARAHRDSMIRLLEEARVERPRDLFLITYLAEVLATRPRTVPEDWERALVLAKEALALAPERTEPWHALGLAHALIGQETEAEAAWKELERRVRPGDQEISMRAVRHFLRAVMAARSGAWDRARQEYDHGVEVTKTAPGVWRAWYHARTEAERLLNEKRP